MILVVVVVLVVVAVEIVVVLVVVIVVVVVTKPDYAVVRGEINLFGWQLLNSVCSPGVCIVSLEHVCLRISAKWTPGIP